MKRAEHLIIFNVKRTSSLEVTLECDRCWGLDVELLWRADLTELLLLVLSRDPGCPPRSAAMMVIVVLVSVQMLSVVLPTIIEELRHGSWLC